MENLSLGTIDIVILVVYLVGIIWYGIRKGRGESSEDYFLAGRNMTWPIVGLSLLAANLGSNTLIGLSADAFQTNTAVYNYEWMAAVVLVFFAVFFMPFYLKSKVYTMPEFLEKRYDARSRYYFSAITIVGNVIIDTATGLYASNLILRIVFPDIPSGVMIALLAFAAAAYTIPGGLSSVVHTEVVQAVLLFAGSILLTYFTMSSVGGWDGMMAGLDAMHNQGTLAKPADEVFDMAGPIDDDYMPWTGLLFGVPLLGFYFWANNQFMVQRVLSAKDLNHGRWGALAAGLMKIPIIFIMIVPGVIAIVLFSDLDISSLNFMIEKEGAMEVCSQLSDCPNMTYPVLIYNLLPTGILGLVIASLLAAMSSSISATMNSASTLITMDFVQKIKPDMTSKQLVRVGQIATFVLVMLAAFWTQYIDKISSSVWEYLQMVLSFIAPPVVAVFILGLFWKRANANGAFAALITGLALSIFVIVSKVNGLIPWVNDLHFLHMGPMIMVTCMLVQAVVSLATTAPSEEVVQTLTYNKQIFAEETAELSGVVWYKNYRILSVFLLITTAIVVAIFW
ncbi:MAG TPA: sodium transporter [Bacteroidetes bacterium]|nr:MAG: sodium transporter [Rhodothermaceae bacterium TMED105]HBW00392.1 sodium transporter [Bacteroidota bacterium]|tara:strand:- start:403 stop:2097 length:1695 start_codon:yes stop_codon:yes gene_type:complete